MNIFHFNLSGELMVMKIAKFKHKNVTTINDPTVKKDFVKKIRFKKYKKISFSY